MSLPSTPFNDNAIDPFLPSIEEDAYTDAEFDRMFGTRSSDEPVFSSSNSEVLDDLYSFFDDTALFPFGSSNTSTISPPDFSSYSLSRQTSPYPFPDADSPQPYPLEHHLPFPARIHPPASQRPLHLRAQTSSGFLLPYHPPKNYVRRRSLSHNDADRIAAAPPNPTFVRLQAPHFRSTTPEEKRERRSSPYPRHRRSVSQGPVRSSGRPLKNAIAYGSPLVDGMFPTQVGTPIGMSLDRSYARDVHNKPVIRHITDPAHLARSQRVIEIGAMAVRKDLQLHPALDDETGLGALEQVLKKLEDVERYLRLDDANNAAAMTSCEAIREALVKSSVEVEEQGDAYGEMEDGLDKPSQVMLDMDIEQQNEFFADCFDEAGLMNFLVEENRRCDSEF